MIIIMKVTVLAVAVMLLSSGSVAGSLTLIDVQEIYGDGTHNGWPDICQWQGRYYVAFNSGGAGHATGLGMLRVLSSSDGEDWQPVGGEIRFSGDFARAEQPKFIPTSDRLYMMFNVESQVESSISDEQKAVLRQKWLDLGGVESSFERWVGHHGTCFRTGITYSEDGESWAEPEPLLELGWRIHSVGKFLGHFYMVPMWCHGQQWVIRPELAKLIPRAHRLAPIFPDESEDHLNPHMIPHGDTLVPLEPRRGKLVEMFESACLMVSEDGRHWTKVSDIAADDNDESGLDFAPDGRVLVVSRRGAAVKNCLAYVSDPPYQQWRTLQLNRMVQQPAVRRVGKQWVVGGRGLDEDSLAAARLAPAVYVDAYCPVDLWILDEETGELSDRLTLPSWGDCGHPGILLTSAGDLLVVYYSCSVRTEETRLMGPGPLPGKYSPCSIYLARVKVE